MRASHSSICIVLQRVFPSYSSVSHTPVCIPCSTIQSVYVLLQFDCHSQMGVYCIILQLACRTLVFTCAHLRRGRTELQKLRVSCEDFFIFSFAPLLVIAEIGKKSQEGNKGQAENKLTYDVTYFSFTISSPTSSSPALRYIHHINFILVLMCFLSHPICR